MTAIAALLLHTSSAHAVTVGNCDDVAHSMEVHVGGERQQHYLQPGERFRTLSPTVQLQTTGSPAPISARYYEHYCIWDGKLTIQRRGLRGRDR